MYIYLYTFIYIYTYIHTYVHKYTYIEKKIHRYQNIRIIQTILTGPIFVRCPYDITFLRNKFSDLCLNNKCLILY